MEIPYLGSVDNRVGKILTSKILSLQGSDTLYASKLVSPGEPAEAGDIDLPFPSPLTTRSSTTAGPPTRSRSSSALRQSFDHRSGVRHRVACPAQ